MKHLCGTCEYWDIDAAKSVPMRYPKHKRVPSTLQVACLIPEPPMPASCDPRNKWASIMMRKDDGAGCPCWKERK